MPDSQPLTVFLLVKNLSLEDKTILSSSCGTILRISQNPLGPLLFVFSQRLMEDKDLPWKVAKYVSRDVVQMTTEPGKECT